MSGFFDSPKSVSSKQLKRLRNERRKLASARMRRTEAKKLRSSIKQEKFQRKHPVLFKLEKRAQKNLTTLARKSGKRAKRKLRSFF